MDSWFYSNLKVLEMYQHQIFLHRFQDIKFPNLSLEISWTWPPPQHDAVDALTYDLVDA